MNHRAFVQCLTAIAVLTLVLTLWPRDERRSVERAHPPSAAMALSEGLGSLETRGAVPQAAESRQSPWIRRRVPRAAPLPNEARVNVSQVLATVNQTPIRLQDLMPVRPDEVQRELTPAQYACRLRRAIEMELTVQAARAQGVELTPMQRQRVKQIAERHQADLEHYKQFGLSWSSISPEQVEFEKRLLVGQMLEQNLVAKKAAVVPSPEPEMQARYEQARRELLDQLQGRANITKTLPTL